VERLIAGCLVVLVKGDITQQAVDAVVNAANSSLLGGGGVDGAIHRAGGPAILEECRAVRRRLPDGLPAGQAVATTGGRLPARRVIHTVGPVWHGGGEGEAEILAAAYRNSLTAARAEGLRTVAFPSISTGAYGYPLEQAARVALETVALELLAHPGALQEVRFVLFSDAAMRAFQAALDALPA
jgi:O-acetyl-ADP-ribose deacetylase (regulator of RNase III)